MASSNKGTSYAKSAQKELDRINKNIARLRDGLSSRRAKESAFSDKPDEIDWDAIYKDLQARARDVGSSLEEVYDELRALDMKDVEDKIDDLRKTSEKKAAKLREESEKRWSEIQASVESGLWDIRAAIQRVGEGVDPILKAAAGGKTRYYLQKAKDGRWSLLKDGAKSPARLFDTKGEGVRVSRAYVRDRRPSELVIRRADGTFERVHSYDR